MKLPNSSLYLQPRLFLRFSKLKEMACFTYVYLSIVLLHVQISGKVNATQKQRDNPICGILLAGEQRIKKRF